MPVRKSLRGFNKLRFLNWLQKDISNTPSEWSTNYILLLNWGYKLGLWTFFLERGTNKRIEVCQSGSLIRKYLANGISVTFILNHILILVTIQVYENSSLKEERNLTETAINFSVTCIGIMLITFDFIFFWHQHFFKSFIENALHLHVNFGE